MKNFIFKSQQDLQKIVQRDLELLLNEQRHQRADLDSIRHMLRQLINSANLQRQVDDYFDDKEDIPEDKDGNTDNR